MFIRSSRATDEWTDLSSGVNDDVMLTDGNRRGEQMKRIMNVYDQRDVQTGERWVWKLNWNRAIPQGGGTIIASVMKSDSRR